MVMIVAVHKWKAEAPRARETSSVADLENFFKKFGPTLYKATEFVPVLQAFPATVEYELSLLKMITELARAG